MEQTLCMSNRPLHHNNKGKEDILNIKVVTMIDPVTGWFEITQYDNKIAISIANLVETMWLTRYHIPHEIMYYQGSECISHEFHK